MKHLLLSIILVPGFLMASPFKATSLAPPALFEAHRAYLDGDLSRAFLSAKDAFTKSLNNSVAQKNILLLVQSMQTDKLSQDLNIGWTLPSEIESMRVLISRRLDDGLINYKMHFAGNYKALKEFTDFQVIRYPDSIIVDQRKKIGNFKDFEMNGKAEYYYGSQSSPFSASPGLYLLKFTTKTGSTIDGWFFITEDDSSTATPQFSGLDNHPIFKTSTPTISWNNFLSPQYNAERDRRMVSVWIGKQDIDEGVFSFWTNEMTTNSVQIGSQLNPDHGWRSGPIADGDYYALLNFNEARSFGPIRIVRRSQTVKNFSVIK